MDITDPALVNEFTRQFNYERYSADVYYALATALDTINLVGFSKYLAGRGDEERTHAKKFSDHMSDRNLRPALGPLPAPSVPLWGEVKEAPGLCFKAALEHEKTVTARIHNLYRVGEDADDPTTCEFLLWFIREQVEEEKSLEEWITRLDLAAECTSGLLLMDQELRG